MLISAKPNCVRNMNEKIRKPTDTVFAAKICWYKRFLPSIQMPSSSHSCAPCINPNDESTHRLSPSFRLLPFIFLAAMDTPKKRKDAPYKRYRKQIGGILSNRLNILSV